MRLAAALCAASLACDLAAATAAGAAPAEPPAPAEPGAAEAAVAPLPGPDAEPAARPDPWPRIRSIRVEQRDVFGPEERLDQIPLLPDLTFVFELANAVHVTTQPAVIRRELLFREGDLADPEILAESERNLRDLDIVRSVDIETVPVSEDLVDVVVHTQDTWTTEPRASFSSGGGESKVEVGFVEKNLLGLGKRVGVRYRDDLDRASTELQYADPRLLGSRWRLDTVLRDSSDGQGVEALVDRPFFSLATAWGGGVQYARREEVNEIFADGGGEIADFEREQEIFSGRIGRRIGPPNRDLVRRLGLYYRWIDDEFRPRPSSERDLLPRDRRRSEPGFFFRREVVDFARERHFNLFDRIEDLNLGNILDGQIGFSSRALGAARDELVATVIDRQGFDFGPGRKAFLFGLVTGRASGGDVTAAVLALEGIAYWRFRALFEQTLVLHGRIDLGRNFTRDLQLFLGNDNGLRGFDVREFVGTNRFNVNFEDRIFFVNDLFHLISVGAVVFVDTGTAWSAGEFDRNRVAGSFGIGLRVGTPRAAGEKIFRFDLAIPFAGAADGRFSPAFSFGSGQAFRPFGGPFDLQSSSGF